MTSREFNRDSGAAKRAAADGPVLITDRGEPAHVLMTFRDYRRLTGAPTIGDLIGMRPTGDPEVDGADLDTPKVTLGLRPADLD